MQCNTGACKTAQLHFRIHLELIASDVRLARIFMDGWRREGSVARANYAAARTRHEGGSTRNAVTETSIMPYAFS
jgi:hypothetical protein